MDELDMLRNFLASVLRLDMELSVKSLFPCFFRQKPQEPWKEIEGLLIIKIFPLRYTI